MSNHARGTILMIAVVCTFVLAGPAPVAAQTSGIQAGLTFEPAGNRLQDVFLQLTEEGIK